MTPRRTHQEEYSGFVIVRLRLSTLHEDSLHEVAKKHHIDGILEILNEFNLTKNRRLIDRDTLAPKKLLELEEKVEDSEFQPLHSLTQYWRIDLRKGAADRTEEIVQRFNDLPDVDLAYREFAVSLPSGPPETFLQTYDPNAHFREQHYLEEAETGIGARQAWYAGFRGAGVNFVDLEKDWHLDHEDLVGTIDPNRVAGQVSAEGDWKVHGTRVLGIVAAANNNIGVVGIAHEVDSVRVGSIYDGSSDSNVTNAICGVLSRYPNEITAGDVLLIMAQSGTAAQDPIEHDSANFDAIRLSVALGLVVIEPAGNGGGRLDRRLSGLDSGAIIVGGGTKMKVDIGGQDYHIHHTGHYGPDIDCYAWSEGIVTCGVGDLAGSSYLDYYTEDFGGTSGASAIIAGAALIVQGAYKAQNGTHLTSPQIRALFKAGGTPSFGDAYLGSLSETRPIGFMPDVNDILVNLGLIPDVYIRDNVGDTGHAPASDPLSSSPDIFVLPQRTEPAAFLTPEAENSTTLGSQAIANQDNFIYVRMKNRGGQPVPGNQAKATVYYSRPSSLITPSMWTLIGETAPLDADAGDVLMIVPQPLVWRPPETGHFCYLAIADHPQDPAPPLPPDAVNGINFDWYNFLNFIRYNNNVAWKNFNVVEAATPPVAQPAPLIFEFRGTPDAEREFSFEIFQRLPTGAGIALDVPDALVQLLTRRSPMHIRAEGVHGRPGHTRLHLPRVPRFVLNNVRLPRGARFVSRFLVQGPPIRRLGGHSFTIRQLYNGEEVGRVTWGFKLRE